MKIYVIESGSRGNSTLLLDNGHLYLIDMGVPLFVLERALASIGHKLIDIEAMLLTHEHGDHTRGISYLPPLPIYTTKGTWDSPNSVDITPYKDFKINNLIITPFSTSHDVNDPVGFVINNGSERLVYLTDSGYIPSKSLSLLKNADYYVIESNYDYRLLIATHRPPSLIRRISSDYGHLSNKDSAKYMAKLVGPLTKGVVLAHISLESNTHEVAIETYRGIFQKAHLDIDDYNIVCASQYEMTYMGK